MPLDTVKLRSPFLQDKTVRQIEGLGRKTTRIHQPTGEIEFEIIRTPLQGSWDSSISIVPMREDCTVGRSGLMEWHPSQPYIYLECSLAKVFHGQNVYGGPEGFQASCELLVRIISNLIRVKLPKAEYWQVNRIDWAECYALPFAAVQDYFSTIQAACFPRRKIQKFGDSGVYVPGTTTTIKLYHKGPEFSEHDSRRLYRRFLNERRSQFPREERENQRLAARKVAALQRLANNRLRVEVELHAAKLDYDFPGRRPRVKEITDEYLKAVHDKEVGRLIREGSSAMLLIRNSKDVQRRLLDLHGSDLGNRLYGFWSSLATLGETGTRHSYKRPTFYRLRKQLQESGVSWLGADIQLIERQNILPVDFSPIRSSPRRCTGQVREVPAFLIEQGLLKLAA